MKHNYKEIEGWFNMEEQYLELLQATPEGGIFVELGAYKGKSTSFIVTEIINRGRNINFTTVDTFQGDSGSKDKVEVEAYKKVNLSKMYDEFVTNTNHLYEHLETIIGKSNETAQLFENESIDCLFIDAGHSYEAVKADIAAWLPKMKNESIMAGHDYTAWKGVKEAVNGAFDKPDKVENDCWFVKVKK